MLAAMLTGVTLGCGTAVQLAVPHLARMTGGHHNALGAWWFALGAAVLSVDAEHPSLLVTIVAAGTLGCAFGVNLVAGLTDVQRSAHPGNLATLTGIYYAVAYAGFALPVVMSELEGLAPLWVQLLGLSGLSALTAIYLSVARRRLRSHRQAVTERPAVSI